MADTRASKLILLTNFSTGGTFYLSVNKIIKFTTVIGAANSLVTYIDDSNTIVTRRVTEAVAAIATAMQSNTVSLAVALTCIENNGQTLPSSVIYFNIERIVSLVSSGANVVAAIDEGKADFEVYTVSSPIITLVAPTVMVPLTEVGGGVIYLNNLFIDMVVVQGTGSKILYDNKRTGFVNFVVTETPASVAALVNAL